MQVKLRQSGYLFFMLVQLGVAPAFADPLQGDEADWLKTMVFAAHQTNYSGVFVYQSGGRVEMSRITHISDADGEHERLEGLDGGRRELIRNNDQVWLFTEDRGTEEAAAVLAGHRLGRDDRREGRGQGRGRAPDRVPRPAGGRRRAPPR